MSDLAKSDIAKSDLAKSDSVKVSYISSEQLVCPVCEYILRREELHGGRGRIVVDTLTEELRHTYKPSEKYGIVTPLLYPITVCPECMYSAFKNDFTRVHKKTIADIKRTKNSRVIALVQIFPQINFKEPRGLTEGIVSYYYAMLCYQYWPSESGPIAKQALSALRIAWLCCDFDDLEPKKNWDAVARVFYRKARYFYRLAWERDQDHTEVMPNDFNLGPDTDKNYGIDGIRYLVGYLEYRWGPSADQDLRRKNLQRVKGLLSMIFDAKRDRKLVPGIIVTNARNLHTAVSEELQDLQ